MPVRYSPSLAASICARFAAGESLSGVARTPGMPSRRTMIRWRARHPDFAAGLALARRLRAALGIKPRGRPTGYRPAIAAAICERIIEGATVDEACADPGFPTRRTVFKWLARHRDFRIRYAQAKRFQLEAMVDRAADILMYLGEPGPERDDAVARFHRSKGLVGQMRAKTYDDPETMERDDRDGEPGRGETLARARELMAELERRAQRR